MANVVVRQKIPRTIVYLDNKVISVRYKRPTIKVYDDKPMPIVATYIDGGTYDQAGTIIDAGFYNTTSWDTVWDGEYPI